MENSLTRILIETVAKKAVHDIKNSPERGIRNLIDMALQFSHGRFQRDFFEIIQTMLENEDSAYYELIRDTIYNVDEDHLIAFGMALGYNSCTAGAKRIRQNEMKRNCNIPWAVKLQVDSETFEQNRYQYLRVIKEGNELGIYTWMIFIDEQIQKLLPFVAENSDNCFFLFCSFKNVTENFLDIASSLNNLMIVVCCDNGVENACQRLRKARLPYSVYYPYSSRDIMAIDDNTLFCMIQELHPLFSIFIAQPDCPNSIQDLAYQSIQIARKTQQYHTILLEMYGDNCKIDEIISDDACDVYFDQKGILHYDRNILMDQNTYNIFDCPLQDVFQQALPKKQVE